MYYLVSLQQTYSQHQLPYKLRNNPPGHATLKVHSVKTKFLKHNIIAVAHLQLPTVFELR